MTSGAGMSELRAAQSELARIRGVHAAFSPDLNSPTQCAGGDPTWPCDAQVLLGILDARSVSTERRLRSLEANVAGHEQQIGHLGTEALRAVVERELAYVAGYDVLPGRLVGARDRILRAALASPDTAPPGTHEPGESHDYRIECRVCGERGVVQLSVEPQRAPPVPG